MQAPPGGPATACRDDRGKIVEQGEDVIGIIDRYIDASGGEKVARDPVTRKRISAPDPDE